MQSSDYQPFAVKTTNIMKVKNYLSTLGFILVTLNSLFSQSPYCASRGTLPWEHWIGNVQLGTINNASSKDGYGNFTSQTTQAAQGTTLGINLLPAYSWAGDPQIATMQWAAWADWNKNNIFEASEILGTGNNISRSVPVVVPATATLGNTRLRIAMKIGGLPTACETFAKGEVEDYTLNVTAPVVNTAGRDTLQIIRATLSRTRVLPGDTVSVSISVLNKGNGASSPNKSMNLYDTRGSFLRSSGIYEYKRFSSVVPLGAAIQPGETLNTTLTFRVDADYTHKKTLRIFTAAPFFLDLNTSVGLSGLQSISYGPLAPDTLPYELRPGLTAILPDADLSITASSTSLAYTGNEINYTVRVRNNGTIPAPFTEVNAFNFFSSFLSATLTPSKGNVATSNIVNQVSSVVGNWYVGTLAPGEEASCQVRVSSDAFNFEGQLLFVTPYVQSLKTNDPNPNNDNAPLTFIRTAPPSLAITNVTGATTGQPSGTLPLAITITNRGTQPSAPDSVFFAKWRRAGFGIGSFPFNYALNRVAVPSIAPGSSLTVNANFTLPATLKSNILNDFQSIEPYIMLKSEADRVSSRGPVDRGLFEVYSYFYPIQPASATDLSLTGSQLNTTWDSVNNGLRVSLTLRNNGTAAAQNVSVNINNTSVTNSSTTFNGTAVDNFTLLSGPGQVSREFTDFNGGREENGAMYALWKIPQIGPGESITATFEGKAVGYVGVPQGIDFYYKDLTIRPYILYADIRDANRANDSVSTFTYRIVRTPTTNLPDLTLANLAIPTRSVQQGNVLNFNFDLRNIGTAAAVGNFVVKSYLSTDPTLSANDYEDGIVPTANFPAGLTSPQVAGAMTVRNTLAPGNYYLILRVDGNDQIVENNENNNILVSTSTISVTAPVTTTCANNLFANGDLENGTTGWEGGGEPTTDANSGTGALRLGTTGVRIYRGASATAGKRYNFSGYFKADGTAQGFLNIKFLNSSYVPISDATLLPISSPNYRFESNPTNPFAVAPSGTAHVEIWMQKSVGSGYVYTDDWCLVEENDNNDPCANDATAPVIANCPQNQSRTILTGECVTILWAPPTATDNCGTPTLSFRSKAGNTLRPESSPTQAIFNTCVSDSLFYTAVDARGNRSVCAFAITLTNGCQPSYATGRGTTTVDLTTAGTCAAYKWEVLADFFPCGRPCQYQGWGRTSVTPNTTVTRVSGSCAQITLDSACFPIGRTTLVYAGANGNTETIVVNVTRQTTGGADIALSIAATPAVYRQFSNNVFRVSARNTGSTAFTNVRIELPFPAKTSNGGNATASVGTWSEWCPGRQCFEWTIPTLAPNSTATLDLPLFVLDATAPIVATTRLLASTPADGNTANNTASVTVTSAMPLQGVGNQALAIRQKPTQRIPVVLHNLYPSLTEGDLMVELESLIEKSVQFYIYTAAGKRVVTETRAIEKGKNLVPFDVYSLPSGVYFIQTDAGVGRGAPIRFSKFS
jgi:hypothetical protein